MKSSLTKQFDLASNLKQALRLIIAFVFVAVTLLPLISANTASAAQLTSRSVLISSSEENDTAVEYDFTFSFASVDARGLVFEFCTTPLGACTLPTGLKVRNDIVTFDGQTNFPTNATTFAEQATNVGGCSDTGATDTVTQYCLLRASTTAGVGTAATIDLGAVENPSAATVYVRIEIYSDGLFATLVHEGVVATAIVNQLTVNGRVQERLAFCVASIGDAAALPADCTAAPGTTTIDIGIIDTNISVSPVSTGVSEQGNDEYGMLQVNTNAANGVVIAYYPDTAATGTSELQSFRVTGSTCSATLEDQCFNAAATGGEAFSTEKFGMYVACVDYTQGSTTAFGNAQVPNAYDGLDNDVATVDADCENEGTAANLEFAWNTATTTIASATGVVDDEIIKLRFGAYAAATTPTGSYTVSLTYIATPTF